MCSQSELKLIFHSLFELLILKFENYAHEPKLETCQLSSSKPLIRCVENHSICNISTPALDYQINSQTQKTQADDDR